MAYSKRIPPIKLVLTRKEYNYLVGILTNNINDSANELIIDLATITKEKLLKYSLPRQAENGNVEIDVRLYINEAVDIITEILFYIDGRMKEIDYYQVLLKVREKLNVEVI